MSEEVVGMLGRGDILKVQGRAWSGMMCWEGLLYYAYCLLLS